MLPCPLMLPRPPQDVKTVQHMEQVNLRKYQVTSVDDALAVMEDNGDLSSFDNSGGSRGTASLERGMSYTTRGGQALHLSQKGKKDNLTFTLSVRLVIIWPGVGVSTSQLMAC